MTTGLLVGGCGGESKKVKDIPEAEGRLKKHRIIAVATFDPKTVHSTSCGRPGVKSLVTRRLSPLTCSRDSWWKDSSVAQSKNLNAFDGLF